MGVEISVNVYTKDCLNRYVVLSEFATISIPKINKHIHKDAKKGCIRTIKECFRIASDELKIKQELDKDEESQEVQDLEDAIHILEQMHEGKEMPYHFLVHDPSGNSYVQNPHAPAKDVYVSTNRHSMNLLKLLKCNLICTKCDISK